MSVTYGIACTQCKQILWVGQGSILYNETVVDTAGFLHEHRGHPLVFEDACADRFDDYEEVDEKYKGKPDPECHFCFATCTGKCGEKEVKP
jgi:hypothetical protein